MSDTDLRSAQLPAALLGLTSTEQSSVLARMKSARRTRQGAEIAAATIATLARRSASSYTNEFFANRARRSTVDDPSIMQVRVAAEIERIVRGNLATLIAKAPPGTGQWTSFRFPRAGWSLLRIEDTNTPGGACCEVCERAQMRHSYVLQHPSWPPADAGAETHACRTCAAHLLGGKTDLRPKRADVARSPLSPPAAAQSAPLHERYPHKYKVPQSKPGDNRDRRASAAELRSGDEVPAVTLPSTSC